MSSLPCAASEMVPRIANRARPTPGIAPNGGATIWYSRSLIRLTLAILFVIDNILRATVLAAQPIPTPMLSTPGVTTEGRSTLPLGHQVIIEVTLNQVKRGDYPVVMREDGDFLLRGEDLQAMEVLPPYGPARVIEGDEYFSLRYLGVTNVRFDETWLRLYADLPVERLPKQGIDFLAQTPSSVHRPDGNSAFFNYRLHNSGNDADGTESWLLGGELGVRYSEWLFRTDAVHLGYGDEWQTIRYGTSLTRDNRETLQRLVVGDFVASSGNLGATLNIGGLSFSKTYAIDPYFIHQPMAGFVGTLSAPSEVELYLDGMRLRSEDLAPGEFELKNLYYYGGRHDLEMVIRDGFGREQRVAYPYYFSEQNLRKGLHDYSYNGGLIRTGVGTSNDEYDDWAISAYHRYGLSDALTLGVRGEAEAGLYNLGTTGVMRSNRWGIMSGAISLSDSKDGSGWAGSAGYVYREKDFHLQGALRRYSSGYGIVGRLDTDERPEQEVMASTGYGVKGFGSLGLSFHQLTQYQGSNRKLASLTYSHTLYRRLNLMAAVTRTVTGDEGSTGFYVGLNYHPGSSLNTSLRHQQDEDRYSDSLQIATTTPVGEGMGYRFSADRNVSDISETVHLSPAVQYNGRYGIVTANLHSETRTGEGTQTGYQWGLSGGIGYVADSFNFARPITDSFAIVDIGDLEGVRVYQSSQEIGRTDKNGRVFLPNLGSYQVNRVAIDDRDIPIDYSLESREVNSSPPLRSGSLISFEVKRYQAVSGRLQVKLESVWVPVEYAELRVELDGTSMIVPTGRGGEFYLENPSPAKYRAIFNYKGIHCDFELAVPDSDDMLIELGELNVCENAR